MKNLKMLNNKNFLDRIKEVIEALGGEFTTDGLKSVDDYESLNNEVFEYGMSNLAEAIEKGGGGGGGTGSGFDITFTGTATALDSGDDTETVPFTCTNENFVMNTNLTFSELMSKWTTLTVNIGIDASNSGWKDYFGKLSFNAIYPWANSEDIWFQFIDQASSDLVTMLSNVGVTIGEGQALVIGSCEIDKPIYPEDSGDSADGVFVIGIVLTEGPTGEIIKSVFVHD